MYQTYKLYNYCSIFTLLQFFVCVYLNWFKLDNYLMSSSACQYHNYEVSIWVLYNNCFTNVNYIIISI